jgi:hypothetical protein
MSNKKNPTEKIENYGEVYDVNSDDEEIVNQDNVNQGNVIELSEVQNIIPQEQPDNRKYKLLNESVKRATNPDELIFRSDVSLGDLEFMKKMRDSKKEATYEIWRDLIEKGRQIDEDVIRMLQNYIIIECRRNNSEENVERCRKYREILSKYWDKNPSLRERQQRVEVGGKRRRSKKYTMKSNKRKSTKKSNKRRYRDTRRYKKYKR